MPAFLLSVVSHVKNLPAPMAGLSRAEGVQRWEVSHGPPRSPPTWSIPRFFFLLLKWNQRDDAALREHSGVHGCNPAYTVADVCVLHKLHRETEVYAVRAGHTNITGVFHQSTADVANHSVPTDRSLTCMRAPRSRRPASPVKFCSMSRI